MLDTFANPMVQPVANDPIAEPFEVARGHARVADGSEPSLLR
jgi:hypothetical protein